MLLRLTRKTNFSFENSSKLYDISSSQKLYFLFSAAVVHLYIFFCCAFINSSVPFSAWVLDVKNLIISEKQKCQVKMGELRGSAKEKQKLITFFLSFKSEDWMPQHSFSRTAISVFPYFTLQLTTLKAESSPAKGGIQLRTSGTLSSSLF